MKKIILTLILIFCFYNISKSQQNESWKIFDDSHIPRIDITINPNSLDWIYNNVHSDSEHVATFRFRNNHIDKTFDSIGFRLRGNTSRVSKKKSFKVSLNTFKKGTNLLGIEKFNLNGEHNDPSIIRSKLFFDHANKAGLISSRANHVEVYINNQYYGLYINVEHIDEEFLNKNFSDDSGNLWKCLYPADLTYKGENPQIYINLNNNGVPVYELKTNEQNMDFTQLVRLIKILNNLSGQAQTDSLFSVLDYTNILKYFAINVLTGNWDDYWSNMNNYYLYYEPSKYIFHLIPYDCDNTFGIDWSGNNWTNANPYNFPKVSSGARPLAEKLLAIPELKNLYTHFIHFFRNNILILSNWENKLDSLKNMITPSAAVDTFRTKDYNFTMNDFSNSYSYSYSNKHVKTGIKQFINLRMNSILNQLSYVNSDPVVYKIDYEPKQPKTSDSIKIFVSAFTPDSLTEVSVKVKRASSQTYETFQMIYQPMTNTKKVEDADRYLVTLPPFANENFIMISIFVKDRLNRSKTYPRNGDIKIQLINNNQQSPIVINEFLADNVNSMPDPNGEHDDWLELYNRSNQPQLLTHKYLTDNPGNLKKWKFTQPNLYLNPNEYLLIWCDENQSQPGIHTNFKLSKSGEYIALTDTDGTTILDSITFGPQNSDISFGRYPDGNNNWIFMQPTPGSSNITTNLISENIPKDFILYQNYPNPFNPSTTISFQLPKPEFIELKIIDPLGREIETLVSSYLNSGKYSFIWNAENIPTGIYFYKIKAGNFSDTKKMLIIK